MARYGLTKAERELLRAIKAAIDETGVCPSHRELAAKLDYSTPSTVSGVVNRLVKRGYLTRLPHQARSLAIVEDADLAERCGELEDVIAKIIMDEPGALDRAADLLPPDKQRKLRTRSAA